MRMWTFDEGILLDENDKAIACTWECEAATERNIELLKSAPEMYAILKAMTSVRKTGTIMSIEPIKELLARIDGEVDINIVKNKS